MPFTVSIDSATGTSIVVGKAELTVPEILEGIKSNCEMPGFTGARSLWDLRDASFSLSREEVRSLAEFAGRGSTLRPPARLAFVASRNLEFGLLRMFEAFREQEGVEIEVFRDYEEALKWVNGEDGPDS